MYEVEEIEEHLAPISGVDINSISDESDFAADSCVEVTSTVDENENELIKWTNYLQLNSDSDEDNDQDYPSTQSALLLQCSSSETSSDNENISQSSHQLGSTNNQNHIDIMPTSSSTIAKKYKRRQWIVTEKLHAVTCFEKKTINTQQPKKVDV
ncbi:unnamed protein product [Rotaria magnacalcarata]|uniref:Uncharacterized protein n=1 Tax=Rotaria magnacalcarata TaxID=392030 RepID=A0A815MWW1_9BILA|nr:unnamed protein product [Rotaria magnacalcarata]CAF1524942.1 unnamed protein product [Rotaria magnacalcarata]CAF2043720.1 unnamed protein product [Rotaria magnacalcarata]